MKFNKWNQIMSLCMLTCAGSIHVIANAKGGSSSGVGNGGAVVVRGDKVLSLSQSGMKFSFDSEYFPAELEGIFSKLLADIIALPLSPESDIKQKLFDAVFPGKERSYRKTTLSGGPSITVLKDTYRRVISSKTAASSTIAIGAITTPENPGYTTYLLPHFFKLDEDAQIEILFHEALWAVIMERNPAWLTLLHEPKYVRDNSPSTDWERFLLRCDLDEDYKIVVQAERAFSRWRQNKKNYLDLISMVESIARDYHYSSANVLEGPKDLGLFAAMSEAIAEAGSFNFPVAHQYPGTLSTAAKSDAGIPLVVYDSKSLKMQIAMQQLQFPAQTDTPTALHLSNLGKVLLEYTVDKYSQIFESDALKIKTQDLRLIARLKRLPLCSQENAGQGSIGLSGLHCNDGEAKTWYQLNDTFGGDPVFMICRHSEGVAGESKIFTVRATGSSSHPDQLADDLITRNVVWRN